MKMRFTFILLLCSLPAAWSQDQQTAEFARGIQYGVSWKIYWDTHLNTWDSEAGDYYEATKAIHQMGGNPPENSKSFTALDGETFYAPVEVDFTKEYQEGVSPGYCRICLTPLLVSRV